MLLSASLALSEDDVGAFVFNSFGGDDELATVVLPFSVTLGNVNYSTVQISTNGFIEFTASPISADFTNDCLPTPAHSGPFVAAYWDDLITDFGASVEYGIVGASPNRVLIVDYDCVTLSGGHNTDFQIQVHEGSSLINVTYFDMAPGAIGQSATIGFQLAGGASAKTYPISCFAAVLDDNANDASPGTQSWSIAPVR